MLIKYYTPFWDQSQEHHCVPSENAIELVHKSSAPGNPEALFS